MNAHLPAIRLEPTQVDNTGGDGGDRQGRGGEGGGGRVEQNMRAWAHYSMQQPLFRIGVFRIAC